MRLLTVREHGKLAWEDNAGEIRAVRSDGWTSDFRHKPLNLTHQSIRLLKLSAHEGEEFRCKLEHFDQDNCPPYEAVSYVWGSEAAIHRIRLNDRWFWVRANLYKFLEHAAQGKVLIKGLLSNPYRPQYLWIDQLCIDQRSTIEKNHQVQAMASIFERAERVICWLGLSDMDTNLGMDLITEYVMLRAKHGFNWTRDAKMTDHAARKGIRNIFSRPYWHRLWIAQDFILGRYLLVVCGERAVLWDDLYRFDTMTHQELFLQRFSDFLYDAHCHFLFRSRRWLLAPYTPSPFHLVLSLLSHLSCADARDRVYGLIGLVNTKVVIDYKKSAAEVFWDAMDLLASVDDANRHLLFRLGNDIRVPYEDFSLHGFEHKLSACEHCAFTDHARIRSIWESLGLDPHWAADKFRS